MIGILKYPAPQLLKASQPATLREAKTIIKKLRQTAAEQDWGVVVGMAAPQIGINKTVFLALDMAYINPTIIWRSSEKMTHFEGCYSLERDRFDYRIVRPQAIGLVYINEIGNFKVKKFIGYEAQILQHEFDHLEGRLINGKP